MTKCREQFDPLLAQSRKVTEDAAEYCHPLFGAEATGDLLLDFDHAQISLRLVVVKRHREIEQEAQHGPLAPRESIQQIASRALFGSPRCSLRLFRLPRCRRRGIGLVPFCEDLVIATKEACQHEDIQFMLAQHFGLLHLGFHFQQELFHLPGPQLLKFFFEKGQLSQMMDVAQRLGEAVALIAQEAIVDAGATKLWSNANGIQSRAPSPGMSRVVGESIGRADVDPPPGCAHAQSGFILVDHVRLHQSRFEAAFHFGQLLVTGLDKAGDAACREPDSQQLLQQLARASVGYSLTFHQVGSHRLNARPILRRSTHGCWKGRSSQMKTPGTLLFFHPMFGDPEPLGRQIDHLASLWHICGLGTQILLAVVAAADRMNEHLIRRLYLPQMMPTMAWLSTGLLAALVSQALGGTHKTIGGGRQTAVMAIFGLLPLEGVDALLLRVDEPFEGFHALLPRANGDEGLFEPFAQILIRLLRLFQLFVFAQQRFLQKILLASNQSEIS